MKNTKGTKIGGGKHQPAPSMAFTPIQYSDSKSGSFGYSTTNLLQLMKVLVLVATTILLCACHRAKNSGAWDVPGSMSDKLLLAISYEPKESLFTTILTNRAETSLLVQVEPRVFHGRIIVERKGRPTTEYMDPVFRGIFLTSLYGIPSQTLRPRQEIIWHFTASQIQDMDGNELDPKALQDAKVYARLDEIAVVPQPSILSKPVPYVANNAKQVSNAISMPSGPSVNSE